MGQIFSGGSSAVDDDSIEYDGSNRISIKNGGTGSCIIVTPDWPLKATIQGTWTVGFDGTVLWYNRVFGPSSTANDGDEVNFDIFLDAGTYSVVIVGQANTNRGIAKILLDATEIMSADMYAGAGANNKLFQTDSISIDRGQYTLKFKADGKNGASSAYGVSFMQIIFIRTGD